MKKPEKLAGVLFLAAVFISPLIFFTDRTRNPYLIQERIYQILLAAAVFLITVKVYKRKEIRLPITFLDKPLLLFAGLAVLSVIISFFKFPDFKDAISAFAGRRILMLIFTCLIPFYAAAALWEKKDFREKMRYAVIAAGSIASFYALMQFLNLDFIWPQTVDPYGQRSVSTLGNPNFLSSYLMVVVFWLLMDILEKKKLKRSFILLFLNLTGLGITMTRSTFVGFGAGILILVFVMARKKGELAERIKKQIAAVAVLTILTGTVFFFSSDQFSSRIKSLVSIERMGAAYTQRMLIWESSLRMFKDSPVTGKGWGNFEIFYPFYQGEIVDRQVYRPHRTHANNSHNFILELLTQTGIAGTGLFFLFIIVFFKGGYNIFKSGGKNQIKVMVLTITAAAFLIDNLLNVSLYFPMPAMLFWLNAGMLAGAGREKALFPQRKINTGRFSFLVPAASLIFGALVVRHNWRYYRASVYFYNGFKYSRQGRLEEAERELLRCYETYPLIVDNNYELGNVYARMQTSEALENAVWAYKEAINANPGYDEIYYNLGVMYMRMNEEERALDSLMEAARINPISRDIWRVMGDIKAEKEENDKAAEYYRKAIELGTPDGGLYNNYGFIMEQKGNFQDAIEAFTKALKADNELTQARRNIERVSQRIYGEKESEIDRLYGEMEIKKNEKRWDDAIETAGEILDINPVDLKANLYSGNLNYKLGNIEEAEGYFEFVLFLYPDNKAAQDNLRIIRESSR